MRCICVTDGRDQHRGLGHQLVGPVTDAAFCSWEARCLLIKPETELLQPILNIHAYLAIVVSL